ncbi:hypothetical protein Trydic_g11947 [Trypoxylus dichotomus]
MSDIVKDFGVIWSRLFDHRPFLNGEIHYTLHEFENLRNDTEVESLFLLLEQITDIKTTQIDRVKQAVDLTIKPSTETLAKALNICEKIAQSEEKYKKDPSLELCRQSRKVEWEKFVDEISYRCKRLDNTFEEKEEELQEFYRDLERKLNLSHSGLANEDDAPLGDRIYLLEEDDHVFMNGLDLSTETTIPTFPSDSTIDDDKLLNLEDLRWVHKKIHENNSTSESKNYFHEIFEGSQVILPQNVEIPRNPDLEKRCNILKAQQQNRQYKAMTKNVDNVRQRHPEDTIAYQMKQLNRHLIAVAQFIFSVIAGFAFGFIGVELLVGRLDFGFRLLLGIICGLTVALAELYFLAKKLNEDISFTIKAEELSKTSKLN